ncbi:MAG: hypothetical protein NW208_06430 [Bryobacter sp.]|nr:hypothetical protein [Bryobacter sp.]
MATIGRLFPISVFRTLFFSFVYLVLASPIRAELCRDVLAPFSSRELEIILRPDRPWYVPGEIMDVDLVFRNRSQRPLVVPSSTKSFEYPLEILFRRVIPTGVGDEVIDSYESVVHRHYRQALSTTGAPLDNILCKTTMDPHLLLPGEEFAIPFKLPESADSVGQGRSINIPVTARGKLRIQAFLGISLTTDVKIAAVRSFDARYVPYPVNTDSYDHFREVMIVETDMGFVLMQSPEVVSTYSLANVKRRLENLNRSQLFQYFGGGLTRSYQSSEPLSFLGQPTLALPFIKPITGK